MRPARRSHRAMADTKSRTCDRLDSSCESLPTAHGRLRSDFAIRTPVRRCAQPWVATRRSAWKGGASAQGRWLRRWGRAKIQLITNERNAAPTRTFQALADRYLKEHAERHKRPRSVEEDRRNLAVHVLPRWA